MLRVDRPPRNPAEPSRRRRCKRALDLTIAGLAFAVLWPLFLAIAALIKLDSPGPVLHRQERIGEKGRPFTLFKFRSMYVGVDPDLHRAHVTRLIEDNLGPDSPGAGSLKLADDPRVTRAGRLLRRTSLDELPQLYNIVRGEMSLVGPRPALAYEVALYQPWHRQRLEALPGITCLWQVQARNQVSFDEMVRLDLQYIERQSIWLDLELLIRTPCAMLSGRGAG